MAMYTSSIVIKSGWSDVRQLFQVITSRYLKKKKNPTDVPISFHLTENERSPNDFRQSFKKIFAKKHFKWR